MANFTLMPEDEAEPNAPYRLPGIVRPPANSALNWGGMSLDQRHAYIANFFEQHGATRSAALGIADALRGESRLSPTIVNPKSGAIGLAQDLGSRKDALLSQRDWADPDVQLHNMLRELLGGDKVAAQHWTEIRQAPRDEARNLWSKYFERPEAGGDTRVGYGIPAPGWNVAPNAIESEQNRSNTDVRLMTPEEYLSLLPPIEDSRASRAKKENLANSLAAGDDIEAIPSLDVAPRGDNLVVADWDGRNRAQAAIDAGVDEIPVSIRGVPQGRQGDFKLLVGNKKVSLPYTFVEVPRPAAPAPPVPPSAAVQARQMVPQAFAPGPTAPQVPPPQAPLVPPSSKPNFYPEIVAGINKDIVNPTGIGYRGVGVPDEATNATAGGRIAAVNAGSAGQIGLGGAIGSALSALNPIGSAQAAESGPTFTPMEDTGSAGPAFTIMRAQAPPSFIPGMDTVAPPLANFLFSPATALAGDIYSAATLPRSMAEWAKRARDAQAKLQIPETPRGQLISNVLNSPGALLGWAITQVLDPQQIESVAPYAKLGMDLLPMAGYIPGRVGNALAAPSRGILNRVLQTPEMRAAAAANRAHAVEMQRGGLAMPTPDIAAQMATAQAADIPIAPMEFSVPDGPKDILLRRALEYSPEAMGGMEKFLKERTEGVRPSSAEPPAGGMLEGMTRDVGRALGTGSAREVGWQTDQDIATATKSRDKYVKQLTDANDAFNKRVKELQRKKQTPAQIAADPDVLQLLADQKNYERGRDTLNQIIKERNEDKKGLKWGQSILSDSTRHEDIRKFLKTATPSSEDALRVGAQDALVQHYKGVVKGSEPLKVTEDEGVREKVVAAFGGNKAEAEEFMDKMELWTRIAKSSKNILRDIDRDSSLPLQDKKLLARTWEAVAHAAAGFITGSHIFSPTYWSLRAGRYLGERMIGGGHGVRTRGEEIAKLMRDPYARLALPGQPGLFSVPPRPGMVPIAPRSARNPLVPTVTERRFPSGFVRSAASPESINALARASLPFMYGAVAPRPAAEEQQ